MFAGNFGREQTLESAGFYGANDLAARQVPNIWGSPAELRTPDTHAGHLPLGALPQVPGFLAATTVDAGLAQSNVGGPVPGSGKHPPPSPDKQVIAQDEATEQMGNPLLLGIAAVVLGAAFLL